MFIPGASNWDLFFLFICTSIKLHINVFVISDKVLKSLYMPSSDLGNKLLL